MIPFSPPKIYQEIIDEVIDTLKSGWITTGPKTKLFEQQITAYCDAKKTLCLNSATIGMELILRWFGVKEGDEVIIPAYTYCATANVVIHCGAKPVMVDCRDDYNMDFAKVKAAITERTKVIIPVDIGGYPCDYECVNVLVKSEEIQKKFKANSPAQKTLNRILVMSDSAHSFGAYYQNKRAGSLTDVSVFSFHAVKNLTTAEGGAIVLNLDDRFDCDEIYKELNTKSLHGQNKDALAKTQKGNWRYDVTEAGFKANMTDINASLGLVELKYYDSESLVRRKAIFEAYEEAFSVEKWAQCPDYKNDEKLSCYHLYMLRIRNVSETQRDAIIQEIFEQEVSVNVHFQPLPLLSFYKNLDYKMSDFPMAWDNYSREISLPVYHNLSDEDVQKVITAVKNAVSKVLQ